MSVRQIATEYRSRFLHFVRCMLGGPIFRGPAFHGFGGWGGGGKKKEKTFFLDFQNDGSPPLTVFLKFLWCTTNSAAYLNTL